MTRIGKLSILLLGSVLIASCDRPTKSARVQIQLPALVKDAKPVAVAQRSGKVSAQVAGGSWGQPIPNSINDFNCYAVFVGGPEADMQDRACIKGSGANFEKFHFHHMVGFRPAGETIEVDLKPGSARKFYVLGVKSLGACQSLENPDNLDQSRISNPLVVGTQTADIVPGDNKIQINASVASDVSSQILQGCSFFGGTGSPEFIELRGPISSNDGNPTSKLGSDTCNRVRMELRSGSGDVLLESPLTLNLGVSTTFGTVGVFHSDAGCSSAAITSTTIAPGEYFRDVFFKAGSSTGTGAISISAAVGSGTLMSSRPIDVAPASSGYFPRLFDSEMQLAANTCADVFYWLVDSYSRTTSTSSGAMSLGVYDLSGDPQSLGALSGSQFLESCSGSQISELGPSNHPGIFSFKMGSLAQDFQIGAQVSSPTLMQVNIVPKAHHLAMTPTSISPYASDCTEVTVQARTAANTPADLSGNDLSFFSIAKRIIAQVYPLDSMLANTYSDNTCLSPPTNPNLTILSAADSSIKTYFTFSSTGGTAIRSWAGSFLSGNNESYLMMTPRWDPGALRASGNNISFFRPRETFSSYIYFPLGNHGLMYSMTANNSPDISLNALGAGNHAIQLNNDQSLTSYIGGSYSNFTYGFMFKPTSIPTASQLVSMRDGSNNEIASLHSNGTLSNQIKLVAFDAGVPVSTDSVPLTFDAWSSFVVSRGANVCRIYINGVQVNSVSCDSSPPLSDSTIGHGSAGVPGLHGEFFITDRVLSAGEVSNYYSYLQSRYPLANLGDVVPATLDIANFQDSSGTYSLTEISAPVTVRVLAESVTGASLQYSKAGQAWITISNNTATNISLMNMEPIEFRVFGPTSSTTSITLTNVSNGNAPLDTFIATVSDVCLVDPSAGVACANGSIFLGYRDGYKYMMTPSGCTDNASPICAGGADSVTRSWQGSGGSPGATNAESVVNVLFPSTTPGNENTAYITSAVNVSNDSAAHFCGNMSYGGATDWFLPSKSELAWMYCLSNPSSHTPPYPQENENCGGTGPTGILSGFNANYYWSSTEGSTSTAHTVNFETGLQSMPNRNTSANHYVRCVRKQPL